MIDAVLSPLGLAMVTVFVNLIVIFAGWWFFIGAEKALAALKSRRESATPVAVDPAKHANIAPELTLLGISHAIIGTYAGKKIPASILVKCEMQPGQSFQVDIPFEGISTAASLGTPPSQRDRVRLLVSMDGLLYSQEIPWRPLA